MSYVKCQQYLKASECLRSEEKLHQLGVVSFPHMKREHGRQFEKKLKSQAKKHIVRNDAPRNTEDLYQHLMRTLGNG